MARLMKAWVVDRPGPVDGPALLRVDRPVPEPKAGEVRVRISVCGVCRTDLHLVEGDLDAAILFAPAGELVPVALEALDRGGTLSIAGIHLSRIPALDYQRHLFEERQLRSVTANTRRDGEEFLALAAAIGISVMTTPYAFDAAAQALRDLAHDRVNGAAVLVNRSTA